MSADGAALLAAAVRAAVLAKAPRRTVQAVAAAVAGVLVRPAAANAAKGTGPSVPAGSQCAAAEGAGDPSPEFLLDSLRAVRSAQRRRKKERRQARKEATRKATPQEEDVKRELVPVRVGALQPAPMDSTDDARAKVPHELEAPAKRMRTDRHGKVLPPEYDDVSDSDFTHQSHDIESVPSTPLGSEPSTPRGGASGAQASEAQRREELLQSFTEARQDWTSQKGRGRAGARQR